MASVNKRRLGTVTASSELCPDSERTKNGLNKVVHTKINEVASVLSFKTHPYVG